MMEDVERSEIRLWRRRWKMEDVERTRPSVRHGEIHLRWKRCRMLDGGWLMEISFSNKKI